MFDDAAAVQSVKNLLAQYIPWEKLLSLSESGDLLKAKLNNPQVLIPLIIGFFLIWNVRSKIVSRFLLFFLTF